MVRLKQLDSITYEKNFRKKNTFDIRIIPSDEGEVEVGDLFIGNVIILIGQKVPLKEKLRDAGTPEGQETRSIADIIYFD